MEYKRYEGNVLEQLNEYGIASIPNVLTSEECQKVRNDIWEGLKKITKNKFDIKKPETWNTFYELFPLHSMLLQRHVGHMQAVWDVRQHPNVIDVFSKIWETEDLLVSFDGLSIHLPPEITNKGWYRNNSWLHTDQSPKKTGVHCYQGLINLYPVNDNDATLSVLEGSHKKHSEFFKEFKKENIKEDWYRINEDEKKWIGCKQYCVKGDEGSMFLWDSRTFHQGIEAQRKRKIPNFRIAIYVCMTPKTLCSESNLKKRIDAFRNLRMTTHWPHIPKLFSTKPRLYPGDTLPDCDEVDLPLLTYRGYKLVGFEYGVQGFMEYICTNFGMNLLEDYDNATKEHKTKFLKSELKKFFS